MSAEKPGQPQENFFKKHKKTIGITLGAGLAALGAHEASKSYAPETEEKPPSISAELDAGTPEPPPEVQGVVVPDKPKPVVEKEDARAKEKPLIPPSPQELRKIVEEAIGKNKLGEFSLSVNDSKDPETIRFRGRGVSVDLPNRVTLNIFLEPPLKPELIIMDVPLGSIRMQVSPGTTEDVKRIAEALNDLELGEKVKEYSKLDIDLQFAKDHLKYKQEGGTDEEIATAQKEYDDLVFRSDGAFQWIREYFEKNGVPFDVK